MLRLLLFTVGGVRFGIDVDQIEGMTAYRGETGDDLCWFHDLLAYGGPPVRYLTPTVIAVRTETEPACRVIIDAMEAIIEVSQDEMACFPPLIEPFALRRGMWGLWWRSGTMTVLLDLLRLLPERSASIRPIDS